MTGSPSLLLRLRNLVTESDVRDDGEYKEVCDEIADELRKYGSLLELTIPRQGGEVGNVFAAFASVEQAAAAAHAVAGRVFAGRTVTVHFES